jgi:hypothetical protein
MFVPFFPLLPPSQTNLPTQHLLDLLEPVNCPAIQSATLLTLVCALIDTPKNTRTFETLDGLLTITSIFKSRETSREVKLKLVEFLYFYLMPETPAIPSNALARTFNGNGREKERESGRSRADSVGEGITKSTEEKQALLGRYLHSVEELVADLRESHPFGNQLEG